MTWQKWHNDLLQETVWHTRLEEGLGVFVMPKPGFHKRYAVFSTNYGSVDSEFRPAEAQAPVGVPDGIAHFLEHQLFESESGHVFDAFANLGASVNAYTSHTMTSYLFSATDNFEAAFAKLLDFVQTPHFTDEGVAKETGIIEQEIQMYQDQPRHRLHMNLLQSLYHAHPVRIDIAGTPETIGRIDKGTLQLCYDTFYHPSNMAVFVVGDEDPDAILEQVRRDVARRGYERRDAVERLFPEEATAPARNRVEETMRAARPLYALGVKEGTVAKDPKEQLRIDVTTSLVLSAALGRSSALYQELYEADLIDDGFGARYQSGPGFGHTVVAGETRDPEQLHERLLSGLAKLRKSGLSEGDVRRAQRQAAGEFVQLFDSLEFIANSFLYYHFKQATVFDYMQLLQEVTPEQVNERLREHVRDEQMALSLVLPT